ILYPRRVLTFREVARLRSFSRAGESLSLTQSAVSQQVAALEREAGTRLLRRGRGELSLTPAGAQLLAHADVVSERLRLADRQLADSAARELRVTVEEGRLDDLAAAVRAGRLHLAVGFQDAAEPLREHAGLRRHDLGE